MSIRCLVWFEGSEQTRAMFYAAVPRVGDIVLFDNIEHEVTRVRWPEQIDAAPEVVVKRL